MAQGQVRGLHQGRGQYLHRGMRHRDADRLFGSSTPGWLPGELTDYGRTFCSLLPDGSDRPSGCVAGRSLGHDRSVRNKPDLDGIKRRYRRARRIERLRRRRKDLANEALLVVLEWGPAMRLPEEWRLEQRRPTERDIDRAAALADAHEVTGVAYDLTAAAWPPDRRQEWGEVDRVAQFAREELAARYPHLDQISLRRAVNQANYSHAK